MKELTPWKAGDRFSAGHLQEGVDRSREIGQIVGGDGVNSISGSGTVISVQRRDREFETHDCIICDPPGSNPEFENCCYWVKRVAAIQQSTDTSNTKPTINDDPIDPDPFVAVNLSEYASDSHILAVGTRVRVFVMKNYGGNNDLFLKRYAFYSGGESIGTKMYQQHMMLTDNTAGWAYGRFHPID